MRPHNWPRRTAALLLLFAPRAAPQFPAGSPLASLVLSWAQDDLLKTITSYPTQPEVESFYFPAKYQQPLDNYFLVEPNRATDYTQNVIFDPCRGQAFNCCNDTFGTPEWELVSADPAASDYGERVRAYADGTRIPPGASRRPAEQLVLDASCEGPNAPPGRVDCVMARVARAAPARFPACWNWNESIVADAGCAAPADGAPLALCMAVGFTQTAHIIQCGGKFRTDEHCGTFLEVHRPGRAEVLAEARLPQLAPSGYRMTVLPTTYRGNDSAVLCWDAALRGAYEVWWVLRTRGGFNVERRVPFTVVSPLCDWDAKTNRFLPFATVGAARSLANFSAFSPDARVFTQPLEWSTLLDAPAPGAAALGPGGVPRDRALTPLAPFAAASRVFAQPRAEGAAPAAPGKGMGATYVPVAAASYVQVGTTEAGGERAYVPAPPPAFNPALWGDATTYTFTPALPDFSVASGVPLPTAAGEIALAAFVAARGYYRRAAARGEPPPSPDDIRAQFAAWRDAPPPVDLAELAAWRAATGGAGDR